jgi:hypothetical protein
MINDEGVILDRVPFTGLVAVGDVVRVYHDYGAVRVVVNGIERADILKALTRSGDVVGVPKGYPKGRTAVAEATVARVPPSPPAR